MTTIITGATGGIGRMVTEQLLERLNPTDLILTTRNPSALAHLAARGVEVRYADYDKPESLADAFGDGDTMLLISTLSVGRREAQHRRAIDAAVKAGVRHIVYTSSGGAHPDNPAIVIPDHVGTEKALHECGVAFTILRDSLYAEVPLTQIGPRALASGQWIGSAGEGQIGFVAKADCVACAAVVLTTPGHEGRTYELTGPELLSFRDACALTAELGGKPIEYVVVTDDQMAEMLASIGVPRRYHEGMFTPGAGTSSIEDIVTYEQGVRGGYFAIHSTHVQELLGRPPLSLRQVYTANAHLLR